jgi:hypothetical protein
MKALSRPNEREYLVELDGIGLKEKDGKPVFSPVGAKPDGSRLFHSIRSSINNSPA